MALLLLASTALALETDQFIAAGKILKDSSAVMNQYFYDNIDKTLEEVNRSDKNYDCKTVALKVMVNVTGKFSISKASTFASKSPLIDRYPEDSVSERGYINQSFYEHAWLPLQVVDLARTININGVYVGTDKFGHFTHQGMSYYKHYLSLKKKGVSEQEAIEQSIIKGFGTEYGILGYFIDGVLSFGDLEGNYEGLMFARDMCRGENPILIKEKNQWAHNPHHRFDVKNYFTPQMDESFNLSFWRRPLYKRVNEKLTKEYCEAKQEPLFNERMNYYKGIFKENLNDRLVRKHILSQARFKRDLENIEAACEN